MMGYRTDNELATLCRNCGMCCDGSLFGRVPLVPKEVAIARKNKLQIIPSETAFEQPCPALATHDQERVCTIYEERPKACHTFSCRLYERHRKEGGELSVRLAAVRRVREIVKTLEDAGIAPEYLDDEKSSSAAPSHLRALHAELLQRLEEDFARA